MDSKLKALKVVELKSILARADVTLPPKANKPELIAKILEIPAALDAYEKLHGGGAKPASEISTPRPAATPAPSPAKPAEPTPAAETESDLLAPPEPFDWSASAELAADAAKKATTASAAAYAAFALPTTATTNAEKSKLLDPLADAATAPAPEPVTASPTNEAEDEEAARRRARAARFGVPLVEPKPALQKKEREQKVKKNPQASPAVAIAKTNGVAAGAKEKKNPVPVKVDEDPAKLADRAKRFGTSGAKGADLHSVEELERRAQRFGIAVNANGTGPAKTGAAGAGHKRAAPAEDVDAEELERRRKRAERFGVPVAKATAKA